MANPEVRILDHAETEAQRGSVAGLRERLLAGLPVTERRLELNGVSTAVLEGGDGPPLVLLHGPLEHAAKWLTVIPSLVTTHRVIAPDLPGHGSSGGLDVPLDADRVLGWLDDLIDCTCSAPPVLCGQLIGGAIAARYASKHGERVSRLVLVDTFGLTAFEPLPEFGQAIGKYMSEPTEETHDRVWRYCAFDFASMRRRMGEAWERVKAYNLDRARVPSLKPAQQRLMETFAFPAILPEDLARIANPTSLIWGRQDLATPLGTAQSASARYGWHLHVIDNCGDDPPMEQPEAFLKALRAELGVASAQATPAGAPDTRLAWDKIASGYDRTNTPTQMWLGKEGLQRAGLRRGTRFLDVASGSGALSIPAARLGAKVLATDQSPVMLELLRARARNEKLEVETRVMDGHALELPDDAFDTVGSQFGVMLFYDMPKAISEMVRVAKPGGCVLIHAYGDPSRIDFLSFLVHAIQSVRPEFNGPPMDPPPLEFRLSNPQRLESELHAAGLKNVSVETITETTEFQSGGALWDWIVSSNPLVETILSSLKLTHHETDVVKQTMEKMVRERAGKNSAAKLTNPINIGLGTK